MEFNKDNFFQNTLAVFTETKEAPRREPDFISYAKRFVKRRAIEDGEYSISYCGGYLCEEGYDSDVYEYKIIEKKEAGYLIQSYTSSKYWYTTEGVYRESDHWGIVSSCLWNIEKSSACIQTGFCAWRKFTKISEEMKIYLTSDLLIREVCEIK